MHFYATDSHLRGFTVTIYIAGSPMKYYKKKHHHHHQQQQQQKT